MMRSALTGMTLALSASTLLAQDEPRIADTDKPSLSWVQNTTAGNATIRYDEQPGEFTLLMVHTTIDETVAGSLVTNGILTAFPFMEQPTEANWTLTDPDLTALSNVTYSGYDPMVPPRRMANYISHFTSSNYPTGYGTENEFGTTWVTRETSSTLVAQPSLNTDERNPWWHASWSTSSLHQVPSFWTSSLGRESVLQSAHEFVSTLPNSPPLDDVAIGYLNDMMDSTIGFEIYVQAIHIKKPDTQGNTDVRLSRHIRIRRRSLGQQGTGWYLAKGPERHVPNPFDATQRWYLAPIGDEMHVEFPAPVASTDQPVRVTAYFTLVGGGVATVQQTPNPLDIHDELLAPHMGIFVVPANAAPGSEVYFEHERAPGVAVAPIGANVNGAARIVTFTPPANPLPPNPLPPGN